MILIGIDVANGFLMKLYHYAPLAGEVEANRWNEETQQNVVKDTISGICISNAFRAIAGRS